MARQVYYWDSDTQKMVPANLYARKASGPKLQIITDEMPGTQHPCDGRVYTSKNKFRQTTKAHGCIEIGNEKQDRCEQRLDKKQRIEDIKRAYYEVSNARR